MSPRAPTPCPILHATAWLALSSLIAAPLQAQSPQQTQSPAATQSPLSLVVMDPLAAPLSCPCVEGYAQRDYAQLGKFLEERLGRPVTVTFSDSLAGALQKEGCTHADIIVGKDSVVRADAAKSNHQLQAVGRLTGQEGDTTQTGLIVVRSGDAAQNVDDLKGYRILFGPAECDEKYDAARTMLTSAGVALPSDANSETSAACSDGACKIIEWGDKEQAAAVISSYAAPLLEGCGTIKKGDLRVVGETAPVPFVTVFVTDRLDAPARETVRAALLDLAAEPKLLLALESLEGFVEPDEAYLRQWPDTIEADRDSLDDTTNSDTINDDAAKQKTNQPGDQAAAWPGWRGPTRDGRAAWLPQSLPAQPQIVWRRPLLRPGLGGIAATSSEVLLGDRDISNNLDEWRCYEADTGDLRWTVSYPALGDLDYDNCPRATPLIAGGKAFLLGAFGDLSCVEIATGDVLWQTNLRVEFGADHELIWGCCSSPLLVDGKLIVNPGAADAAWVALDAETGEEVWRTPGDRHAYASPILATLGGVRQIVAYDRTSLLGLDPATGRRLWTLKPPLPGDFNVPTPVVIAGKLLVVTENNGARMYDFESGGKIIQEPIAQQRRLRPDMSTPVVVGNKVYCVWRKLMCLDAQTLQVDWESRDRALGTFGVTLATGDRLLVVGRGGELLLLDTSANAYQAVSRLPLTSDPAATTAELYAQPALVGTRLYVRNNDALLCVNLGHAS